MKKSALFLSLLFSLLILSACTTSISEYRGGTPTLKLEEFFNGELVAYGMVQDRQGKVLRRFTVDMQASWQKSKGVLKEDFIYDDGEHQHRTWYLEKTADGRYRGTASDVTRDAEGATEGFALNWHYTLAIPVDGDTWDINFNDWMYLINENRLLNRAEMSKWGFKVGEVTLIIEKLAPQLNEQN